MAEIPDKFDAIVIGAGPAGSASAYYLATKGFKVLVLERGRSPGSKNVFGGRVYVAPLKEIFPDFEKSAPIHRWVTRERMSFMHGNELVSLDYEGNDHKSFTTYLSQLAAWMALKAESAGASIVSDITVTGLLKEGDKVIGIKAGNESVKADVVIDAEGVNRLVLESTGLVQALKPSQVALGVKEVVKVNPEVLANEFGLGEGEGMAWSLMGDVTSGLPGGGFIYTNKDSVSIGLVMLLDSAISGANDEVYKYVERLKTHPKLSKYFKDSRIMEYSAHLIPEDVSSLMPPRLAYDGLLISGDAAGFLLNLGYTYRGVDFAAYSGYLAGKAIEQAHGLGGMSAANLLVYTKLLDQSFIMKNLKRFSGTHKLMRNRRLFTAYPAMMASLMRHIYSLDYESQKMFNTVLGSAKENGMGPFTLLTDGIEVMRYL
ncbi:MAG: FAD-dependent oxidoreductase [Thaumarchaeota archaeon]|jgi:electron transfer flavoprotein-quinone oxidoreductase|nr:FAD-dependent oxidoreductase [Nitrososphaerota archaeon]